VPAAAGFGLELLVLPGLPVLPVEPVLASPPEAFVSLVPPAPDPLPLSLDTELAPLPEPERLSVR